MVTVSPIILSIYLKIWERAIDGIWLANNISILFFEFKLTVYLSLPMISWNDGVDWRQCQKLWNYSKYVYSSFLLLKHCTFDEINGIGTKLNYHVQFIDNTLPLIGAIEPFRGIIVIFVIVLLLGLSGSPSSIGLSLMTT